MKRYYIFMAVLVALCAVVVTLQSLASGPIKADQALVKRLQDTQGDIQTFATGHNRLPRSLSEVPGDRAGVTYDQVDAKTFKLCGTFKTATINQHETPPAGDGTYIDASQHRAGYQCFTASTYSFRPN